MSPNFEVKLFSHFLFFSPVFGFWYRSIYWLFTEYIFVILFFYILNSNSCRFAFPVYYTKDDTNRQVHKHQHGICLQTNRPSQNRTWENKFDIKNLKHYHIHWYTISIGVSETCESAINVHISFTIIILIFFYFSDKFSWYRVDIYWPRRRSKQNTVQNEGKRNE